MTVVWIIHGNFSRSTVRSVWVARTNNPSQYDPKAARSPSLYLHSNLVNKQDSSITSLLTPRLVNPAAAGRLYPRFFCCLKYCHFAITIHGRGDSSTYIRARVPNELLLVIYGFQGLESYFGYCLLLRHVMDLNHLDIGLTIILTRRR